MRLVSAKGEAFFLGLGVNAVVGVGSVFVGAYFDLIGLLALVGAIVLCVMNYKLAKRTELRGGAGQWYASSVIFVALPVSALYALIGVLDPTSGVGILFLPILFAIVCAYAGVGDGRDEWPRRAAQLNMCPDCRYSLVGLLGDECPECGWERDEGGAG